MGQTGYSQEALSACKHRTDASGHVIFDDPMCAKRYRTDTAMGSSYQNVDISRESAYFDRHMGNAVKHAREAEIAANNGHSAEMMRHAELALDYAKEAQRAGNVPGLPQGIAELRQTLHHGQEMQWQDSTAHVSQARMHLSEAAGIKSRDKRLGGPVAASTAGRSSANRRTVTGELVGDETSPSSGGSRQYVLRDRSGQETRIVLTPDMEQSVKAGDQVQAVLDPDGRVVAINKE